MIILPFVVRAFDSEDLGLWYVMSAAGALSLLVDFGFSPTSMRTVAMLFAGARTLLARGQSGSVTGSPNWPAIVSLYSVNREIYRWLSFLTTTLYLLAILFALSGKWNKLSMPQWLAVGSGVAFSCGTILSISCSAFLSGLGRVLEVHRIIVIAQLLFLVLAVAVLNLGGGIAGFAAVSLVQPLLRWYLSQKLLRTCLDGKMPSPATEWEPRSILKVLWPNTWRYGVAAFGGYLIINANILLVSRNLGLADVSAFGLSNQAIALLVSLSGVFLSAKLPQIIACGVTKNLAVYRQLFFRCHCYGLITYIIGAIILAYFGDPILKILGSNSVFLPQAQLIFFLAYRLFEFNHSQFASLVISGNEMPFMWPALLSGLAIFALSTLTINSWGIYGVLASTAFVQLAFNNWYPVVLGLRRLRGHSPLSLEEAG